jgi:hypothetical protein
MKEQKLMIFHQDFNTWWEGDRLQIRTPRNNYLNKADKISNALFKKPYSDCLTYEKNYIVKMIVKGLF